MSDKLVRLDDVLAIVKPHGAPQRTINAIDALPVVDVKELVEALRWYGEQSRLARLIHSEGDAGRHAIAADGGKRAAAALAAFEKEVSK
jgi:hypothetical protein